MKAQGINNGAFKHGHTSGGNLTPEFHSWKSMKSRCLNSSVRAYPNYGGRGVTVCERWQSFENFLADMGPRPEGTSLDRYPNMNGNYEPGNCRWATKAQQARNTRAVIRVHFNGKTKLLIDWAEELGINSRTLHRRFELGWTVQRAFAQTVKARTDLRPPICVNHGLLTLDDFYVYPSGIRMKFCRDCHKERVTRQQNERRQKKYAAAREYSIPPVIHEVVA